MMAACPWDMEIRCLKEKLHERMMEDIIGAHFPGLFVCWGVNSHCFPMVGMGNSTHQPKSRGL